MEIAYALGSVLEIAILPVSEGMMLKRMKWLCGAVLALSLVLLFVPVMATSEIAVWSLAGSMANARHEHTATLLPNGKVLVAGGYSNSDVYSSAELYDPTNNSWSSAGSMATARVDFTATLLNNGKVLMAGGPNVSSAELYDPVTNSWSAASSMATARTGHTATLLSNGKVLVAGGAGDGNYHSSAELYDPVTNSWSPAGSMTIGGVLQSAVELPNGKVLVTGGFTYNSTFLGSLARAELYDPVTNSWSAAGSMATARDAHSATLLPNGMVLVAGGEWNSTILASAELYDPITNSWRSAGSMATARRMQTATLLPNGKVLVAGGYVYIGYYNITLSSTELYDPVNNSWGPADSMLNARDYHTATLLPNSKLLVAGGSNDSGLLSSAELYSPGKDTSAPTTTALPLGGTYSSPQTVTLTVNEPATIFYTTNGDDPTINSSVYSGPISITATTTLKFFARDVAGNSESIQPVVYNITSTGGGGTGGGGTGGGGTVGGTSVPVMEGWWLLPGMLAGVGILAGRRKE